MLCQLFNISAFSYLKMMYIDRFQINRKYEDLNDKPVSTINEKS